MITFGLLGLAIGAVWINPIDVRKQYSFQPWLFLFIGACASGSLSGYLDISAIIIISLYVFVAYLATRAAASQLQKITSSSMVVILSLALAMHKVPGFNNPAVLVSIQFSENAPAFTQYANFDKGVVGLILLAFFCKRTTTTVEFLAICKRTIPLAALTLVCVIAFAMAIGYVQPDIKASWSSPAFLVTNLLFAIVAEEAFFRGLIQDRLTTSFRGLRFGGYISVVLSAVFFGIAHLAGGINYFTVALLGGIGYAYGYLIFRRIETPILMHFVLNAVHFIGFTYPHVK